MYEFLFDDVDLQNQFLANMRRYNHMFSRDIVFNHKISWVDARSIVYGKYHSILEDALSKYEDYGVAMYQNASSGGYEIIHKAKIWEKIYNLTIPNLGKFIRYLEMLLKMIDVEEDKYNRVWYGYLKEWG